MEITNRFKSICDDLSKEKTNFDMPISSAKSKVASIIKDNKSIYEQIYIECITFDSQQVDSSINSAFNYTLMMSTFLIALFTFTFDSIINSLRHIVPALIGLLFSTILLLLAITLYQFFRKYSYYKNMYKWKPYVQSALLEYGRIKNWINPS